ncbi:MAG: zinc-ribbon domain-containing protein [Clostridiales Family XIII bacterium]|jgi:hypothetical protein|nr:zinc-ribbon domain-containing protein [Clostridiales Family XIII bacterium]
MYCSKCGKKNIDLARFCAYCGSAMADGLPRPAGAAHAPTGAWQAPGGPGQAAQRQAPAGAADVWEQAPAGAAAPGAGQAALRGPKQTPYWELPKRPLNMFYWSTPPAPDAAGAHPAAADSAGSQPAVAALFTASAPEPTPTAAVQTAPEPTPWPAQGAAKAAPESTPWPAQGATQAAPAAAARPASTAAPRPAPEAISASAPGGPQQAAPVFPEPPKPPWMAGRGQQRGQQAEAQGLSVLRPQGSEPRYGT